MRGGLLISSKGSTSQRARQRQTLSSEPPTFSKALPIHPNEPLNTTDTPVFHDRELENSVSAVSHLSLNGKNLLTRLKKNITSEHLVKSSTRT